MNLSTIQTPGVYIQELNAFPNSVVGVPTAVPAFIGYTPQAAYEGKSCKNVPVKITSFADFQAFFCLPNPPGTPNPSKQYNPEYYLAAEKSQPLKGEYILIAGTYYSIVPDPNTVYYLYNSVSFFYENGGGDAYIVSVGGYGPPSKKPVALGVPVVNLNVKLDDLTKGLSLLINAQEPTMYICPEATLLSIEDNGTLMQSMLLQASQIQTAMCLFDIIGGSAPDPVLYTQDITNFRMNTGSVGLSYGMAYYPFVGTKIMQNSDIDYTTLFSGDLKQLEAILNPPTAPNSAVTAIIANIQNPASTLTVTQNHNALLTASQTYSLMIKHIVSDANILPPSGGMAGVITTVDNTIGPWQAPANVSLVGAASLPISLSESQQANLNLDPVSGKSINAIRTFNGLGILIWGARTLDGNSLDWRYISVRRTVIFLEQSCKLAAQAYAFQPNNKNTWQAVISMISSFLTSIWNQGGLQGGSPSDGFSVACGLGSTMTADDLFNGHMNVTIKVAVVHPAEFIVLIFQQQMTTSG